MRCKIHAKYGTQYIGVSPLETPTSCGLTSYSEYGSVCARPGSYHTASSLSSAMIALPHFKRHVKGYFQKDARRPPKKSAIGPKKNVARALTCGIL